MEKEIYEWGGLVGSVGSASEFKNPRGVYVDVNGYVFVADTGNHRVVVYRPIPGGGLTLFKTFGSKGSGKKQLIFPTGVCVDNSGNIYVADSGNQRIVVFQP